MLCALLRLNPFGLPAGGVACLPEAGCNPEPCWDTLGSAGPPRAYGALAAAKIAASLER